MTLTPPATPPLGTPSNVGVYDKFNAEPSSQRSLNSKDANVSSTRSGNFVCLGQLEEGALAPFAQGPTSISFWFPRENSSSHDRLEDDRASIQPGRPVDLFAWSHMGLLVNYGALGFFDGMLPLLIQTLHVAGSREEIKIMTLRHSLLLLRVVFALVSDTVFTSSSTRRRGFLMAGWALTMLFTATLAGISFRSSPGTNSSTHYSLLLMLLPIGHAIAGASADGLMVEYAHREVEDERGCTQMLFLATRAVGELIGRSLVSTGDPYTAVSECNTSFDCVLPLKIIFTIAASIAFLAMVCSAFVTYLPKRSRLAMGYAIITSKFTSKLRQTWNYHQNPVYVSFLIFAFLQTISVAWASPTPKELARDWLQINPSSSLVSDGINRSSQMLAAFLMLALWRNTDWRSTTFWFVVVGTVVAQLPAAMLFLMDVSRSEVLFFTTHHIAVVCDWLAMMVRQLIAAEMTMPHMEATSYAATMTVFDLGTIAGSFASSGIASMRPGFTEQHTKVSIAVICLALYLVRLLVNIASLRLLPQQKKELQRRLHTPKKSWISGAVLGAFALLLVAAITFNAYALGTGTSGVVWGNSLLVTFL